MVGPRPDEPQPPAPLAVLGQEAGAPEQRHPRAPAAATADGDAEETAKGSRYENAPPRMDA